jgi:hypothetical protein
MVPSGGRGEGGRRADLAPSLHTTMPAPTFTEIRKTVDNYSYSFFHINILFLFKIKSFFKIFTSQLYVNN